MINFVKLKLHQIPPGFASPTIPYLTEPTIVSLLFINEAAVPIAFIPPEIALPVGPNAPAIVETVFHIGLITFIIVLIQEPPALFLDPTLDYGVAVGK